MADQGFDKGTTDQLRNSYPDLFPRTHQLPQNANRLLANLPPRQAAEQEFSGLRSKFAYWRDGQFVDGAREAQRQFEASGKGDFFKGTYFIVDTGLAHSIAVGGWLTNNQVDTAIALPETGKLTGRERPGVILTLMDDVMRQRSDSPQGFATLLEIHRDDIAIGNPTDNDVELADFLPLDAYSDLEVQKVVVLTERVHGEYEPKTLHGTLSQYVEGAKKKGVDISIYGIDKFATDRRRSGASDSDLYPQSFNNVTPEELIRGFIEGGHYAPNPTRFSVPRIGNHDDFRLPNLKPDTTKIDLDEVRKLIDKLFGENKDKS